MWGNRKHIAQHKTCAEIPKKETYGPRPVFDADLLWFGMIGAACGGLQAGFIQACPDLVWQTLQGLDRQRI